MKDLNEKMARWKCSLCGEPVRGECVGLLVYRRNLAEPVPTLLSNTTAKVVCLDCEKRVGFLLKEEGGDAQ